MNEYIYYVHETKTLIRFQADNYTDAMEYMEANNIDKLEGELWMVCGTENKSWTMFHCHIQMGKQERNMVMKFIENFTWIMATILIVIIVVLTVNLLWANSKLKQT